RLSTTAEGSPLGPILQEPAWWFSGAVCILTAHSQYASHPNLNFSQPFTGVLSSFTPYLFRALVSANLRANLIPSTKVFTSSGATEAVPDFHSIRLPGGLVDEHPGDGGVQHHVKVGAVLGWSQEGTGHTQPGPVAVGGLSD
ncbi:hypothetical protein SFRURICE_021129, partial [Spodoptera frugiperda]